MPHYHVSRAGEQLGVFPQEDVLAKLNRGELLPSDLAWAEGMSNWQPLASLFPPSHGVPPPVPPRRWITLFPWSFRLTARAGPSLRGT